MTTPVPSNATLALLRIRIGLDATDTSNDANLSTAYSVTVQWLENYLDRILFSETGTETETFTHLNLHVLSLKGYPTIDVTSITTSDSSPEFHLEHKTGLIHFDGRLFAHEVTVVYTMEDPMVGPLQLAMLMVFDTVWSNLASAGSVSGGAVKAISSDGARVEFDTSSAAALATGIDPDTGLPAQVVGILQGFRRLKC